MALKDNEIIPVFTKNSGQTGLNNNEFDALVNEGVISSDVEWNGIQLELNTGFFPAGHGTPAANITTTATALYLVPFVKPKNTGDLSSISIFGENNGATAANRFRYGLWDNTGAVINDGIIGASMTGDGVKTLAFTPNIIIPTDSFWFGFSTFEDGGTWEPVEFRTGNPISYPGLKGNIGNPALGTVPSIPLFIVLTNPTDAMPPLSQPLFNVNAIYPTLFSCVANYS